MGKMWCMHTCTFAGILWIIILPTRPSRCLCSQHSRCGCPSILIPAAVVALSLSFFPPPAPRRSASSSLAASLPRAPPSTFFAASNRSVLRASPAPASPVDSTAAHPFLLLRPPRFSSPAFSTASTFFVAPKTLPGKKANRLCPRGPGYPAKRTTPFPTFSPTFSPTFFTTSAFQL